MSNRDNSGIYCVLIASEMPHGGWKPHATQTKPACAGYFIHFTVHISTQSNLFTLKKVYFMALLPNGD
jgi:hypothetical protein